MTEPAPVDGAALVAQAKALGVNLDADAATQLLAYLDAMLLVNQQVNLTAIRDRAQAVVLHVLDTLALGRLPLQAHHALDLGSGNGFPGVAVAALYPQASIVLMDRTQKKVRAMGACLMTAGLDRVETMALDAAQAPALQRELRSAFDLVTARALGTPDEVAELAAPLCQGGGSLLLWLEGGAVPAVKLPSFRLVRSEHYQLPEPAARERVLAWYRRS